MASVTILTLVSLFCAGLLAGAEVVIHFALSGAMASLEERAHLQLRQAFIYRLRTLMPALFVPACLCGVAVAVLHGADSALWLRLLGLAAAAVWLATRVLATARINAATLQWTPEALPNDWQKQIARAERFHDAGTWAALLLFLTGLLAACMGTRS